MFHFDIVGLKLRISELDMKMQGPNFWDDIEKAQIVSQESKGLKDRLLNFNNTKDKFEEIEVMIELSKEEEDASYFDDIKTGLQELEKELSDFKIQLLLSGDYDKNNAIITFHAGAGGTDAQDWTEMLIRMYTRWAANQGYSVSTLDFLPGDDAGVKSCSLKIEGEFAYGYLKSEKGIHRLVRISPFNANGKRQTSFASVEILPELTESQDIEIKQDDLKIDTYRASGAGGQHINKTDSAVRITHIPTGIVVQCQTQRSQHHNKDTALNMLKAKLAELKERQHKERIEDLTGDLMDNGWGSQIRSYVFHPYNMVKDHRTNAETGNVNAVMDGEIDMFMKEYLRYSSK